MSILQDKIVLVTGAGAGIGRATALAMAEVGADGPPGYGYPGYSGQPGYPAYSGPPGYGYQSRPPYSLYSGSGDPMAGYPGDRPSEDWSTGAEYVISLLAEFRPKIYLDPHYETSSASVRMPSCFKSQNRHSFPPKQWISLWKTFSLT